MYNDYVSIWKDPGNIFTPIPFWFWNDKLNKEELIRQINDFHQKGVDGFVIHPRLGLETEYLSDEFFDMVEVCLEEAEHRNMVVVLYDEAMYPSGSAHGRIAAENPYLAARALTAIKSEETSADAEILYRFWIKLDENGQLEDVLSAPHTENDMYVGYNFILTYTEGTIRGLLPEEDDGQPNAPKAADILNPYAVKLFTQYTHDLYYERLSRFFGKTVIGFFTDEPSACGRYPNMDRRISWTYDLHEDFFACGGQFTDIAALLFPTKDAGISQKAAKIYNKTLQYRLNNAYYQTLSDWCQEHNVALMGHPAESGDCDTLLKFTVPGQDLVWRAVTEENALTSRDSVMAKLAADVARHIGALRNSNECFGVCGEDGNPWNFTPDNMMWYLNFLFARGCNMVFPHAFYYSVRTPLQSTERPPDVGPNNIWWEDYQKIAMYIKRLSWLNTSSVNHAHVAVLCSQEYVPIRSVEPLYKKGYMFNYLTLDALMNHTDVVGETLRTGQNMYDVVLIDSSLSIDPVIAEKIAQYHKQGGRIYTGSNFIDFVEKHVKRTSYFAGDNSENLRFVHLSKNGYPFFLLVNEGRTEITGKLFTDQEGAAADFDTFTGNICPAAAKMIGHGFEYDLTIPPHTVKVIGINPDEPTITFMEPERELYLQEVFTSDNENMTFSCRKDISKVMLTFTDIHDIVDVTVNGKYAGRLLFMPYELDITELTRPDENTIEITVIGSMANKYGKPVPVGVEGFMVKFYAQTQSW